MRSFFHRHPVIFSILAAIIFFLLSFIILNFIFPLRSNIQYSQIIVSEDGVVMHAYLSADEKWRMKTELKEIIPDLKKVFIEKEDNYFYYHPGFNPFAIVRAVFNNVIKGKKTSGASTITMQVARLLEPKERTYFNKVLEIFRAMQLELYYSKDEILQMYINLVPYGGNIEGVKSASLLYFGRNPDHLSLAQIVTLAIIPNRPTSLKPGRNNALIVEERNRWLKKFSGIFPEEEITSALQEPLDAARMPAPRLAPHFCRRLSRKHPEMEIIKTTIKTSVQEKIFNITANYIRRTKNRHIHNAAVLVYNNQTRSIEAYLGSPDFYDQDNAGQVDGVKAVRSPGSTLKPLVYALGFDEGILTPKTMISDVPTDFDGYMPENFDRKFNGMVSMERALAFSLNVPAVKTLEELGVSRLVQSLKKAGFRQIARDEANLGLSVILGGCGVTLEELTGLFSAFANAGKLHEMQYLQDKTPAQDKGVQLISPSAAYVITDVLTQIIRPDLPNNFQNSYRVPRVAWKTGTSYGRRDAWSIGYNKKYTIGVWVGNFSGEGVPELTGADIATPLLFEIFNTLDYNSDKEWIFKPKELKLRFVCPESGTTPEEFCENTVADYFLPGISRHLKCEHMKTVLVSSDEKFSYCTACVPENGYKKKLYPNFSPELIDFYHSHHIPFMRIPAHNPYCDKVFSGKGPKIISPLDGKEYFLEKNDPAEIMLKSQCANDVKKVFWYINNKFLREARAGEKVFFTPEAGQVRISCVDDKGRAAHATVIVRYF